MSFGLSHPLNYPVTILKKRCKNLSDLNSFFMFLIMPAVTRIDKIYTGY